MSLSDTFEKEYNALSCAAQQGEDIWDGSKALAMEMAHDLDQRQLRLGDLACLVVKQKGQDTIGVWATEIGHSRKTITDYRTVSHFWPKEERDAVLDELPRLNYSLLKLAANRFASREEALPFLIECVDQEWSVEKARVALNRRMGRVVPPQKFIPASHVEITHLDPLNGTMTVRFIGGLFPAHLSAGITGKLTMTAAGEAVEVRA